MDGGPLSSPEKHLLIQYHNISGGRSKLARINASLTNATHDIIIITETWFDNSVNDNEIISNTRFLISRSDRSAAAGKKKGGGVAVIYDSNIPCRRLANYSDSLVDYIAMEITLLNDKLLLLAAYIPPYRQLETMRILKEVSEKYMKTTRAHRILLIGDFNLPFIKWEQRDGEPGFLVPTIDSAPAHFATFVDMVSNLQVHQINSHANSLGTFLDLVLATDVDNITVSAVEPSQEIDRESLHHKPLEIIVAGMSAEAVTDELLEFKTDMNKVCELMQTTNMPTDPEDFATTIKHIIDTSTRTKQVKTSAWLQQHPWLRGVAQYETLNKEQKRLYSKYSRSRTTGNREAYRSKAKEVISLHNTLKADYYERIIHEPLRNSKEFYELMKARTGKKQIIPNLMFKNGIWMTGRELHENLFYQLESHFSFEDTFFAEDDNVVKLQLMRLHELHYCEVHIWNEVEVDFSIEEVGETISMLKTRKGKGPHEISASVLQWNAATLLPHIQKIFNELLREGIIPYSWKTSYLQPVPKRGAVSDITNYRGIAISSCLPKMLDRLITDRLFRGLSAILPKTQHGFCNGRSTATNLMDVTQLIQEGFREGCQVEVVYFDISKAFDRLNHRILAVKLARIGLPKRLFLLLMSLVINRRYIMKIGRQTTDLITRPKSAVPQGSYGGPPIFLSYAMDFLLDCGDVHAFAYADDLKLVKIIRSEVDQIALQQSINRFSKWCSLNQMEVNVKKSVHMTYTRRSPKFPTAFYMSGQRIPTSNTVRDLGVIFDPALTFKPHIEDISARANRMLGAATRFAKELGRNQLVFNVFRCHILPVLEYASPAWDQRRIGLSRLIETSARKASRIALGLPKLPINARYQDYPSRLRLLHFNTLESRRIIATIIFVIKSINGDIDSETAKRLIDLRTTAITRLPNIFRVDRDIPTTSPLSILTQTCNTYRNLIDLNISLPVLKFRLKQHFLNEDIL